jgi:hypothetical protein
VAVHPPRLGLGEVDSAQAGGRFGRLYEEAGPPLRSPGTVRAWSLIALAARC